MDRRRLLPAVAFTLLSMLLAGTMWVVPYLPTNDGPEWAFAAHVENHYGDPGTIYRDELFPSSQFAARGFTPILGLFDDLLGWQRGLSAALTVTVLLAAWGFAVFVRTLEPRRWALGFLGFPLALSWEFYMGLWAFVVSTAVGFVVLALAVHLRAPSWRGRALLSLALLANAVAHVFGAVLTGGAVLLLSVARAPHGTRVREVGRVALTGLPAAAVLAACVVVSRRAPALTMARGFEWLAWRDAVTILPRTIAPGPLGRALLVTTLVLAATGLALVRARRRDTEGTDRGLGIAAVALLLLGLFAPFQLPGWQAFSQRFFPLGVALAVALIPLERLTSMAQRLAPPALFAVAAAWIGLTYPFHQRLAALCPEAIAGLAAPIKLTGSILSVVIRGTELPKYDRIGGEVPLMVPLRHMGTLYAAAHGGVPTVIFAGNPAIDSFVQRPTAPVRPVPDTEHYLRAIASPEFHHDLSYRRDVDDELASFGLFYDEVIVFGALPEDLAVWRGRGYVADWAGSATLVAHFEPCGVDFTTPVAASQPGPTFDLGDGRVGLVTGAHRPSIVGEDGLAHFRLAEAPCGLVSVRARWEPGADGVAPRCANANADGVILARVSRTEHRVTCELP